MNRLSELALDFFVFLAKAAVTIAGLAAIIAVVGIAMDSRTDYVTERDSCLKQATNGYEIERCR